MQTRVAAVIGFSLGAATTQSKAAETAELIQQGADEIDMVINVGFLVDGDKDYVLQDIKAVVEAAGSHTVKVIMETALLTKDQLIDGCLLAVLAGAHYVKTCTGFGGGGASVEDVRLMKQVVGDSALVKASGGVRTYEDAVAMIQAGASRIGTSSGIAIVSGATTTTTGY